MALSAVEEATLLEENAKLKRELAKRPASKARPLNAVEQTEMEDLATVGTIKARSTSRGFRLIKAIGLKIGRLQPEECQPEVEAINAFETAMKENGCYPRDSSLYGFQMPMAGDLLVDELRYHKAYKAFTDSWKAGMGDIDLDEIRHLAAKNKSANNAVYKTAMSFLDSLTGGTLVAAPVQGELIELIRPREVLMAAGCTVVPLPPNGRISYPRQISATTMYWVGENTAVTESNPQTGQVNMQARKGGVLVRVPNELFRYSSVAADAMIRNDAAKTLALGIDYAGLYGTGSLQPKGLIQYTDTNQLIDYAGQSPAPKGVATDGNRLRPEDGYRMIGLLEDRNFEMSGWIMRPSMANNILGYRADAASPGDAAGNFVQSLMRATAERFPMDQWHGYKVTKSAVVRGDQTKGSGTSLTEVFFGQWEHLLLGMHGAVEFAQATQGDTTFPADQTLIRALVHVDVVPRYEGAFGYYKQLLNSVN